MYNVLKLLSMCKSLVFNCLKRTLKRCFKTALN
ncbi:unnamed protein product [Schistosoma mattheei]|uniref:Uncharacterized protein n=1 Tax=Schistosoma mattheei TaxID=31246 RepID=A0A183Q7P0_9TREM|nr:unnamed protein product [Schistosoma mattheei]